MIAAGTATLRARLREATWTAHGKVDALFGSADLATTAGYGLFLSAQAKAWETLRPLLDSASTARSDALRRDLAALGLGVPEPFSVALPGEVTLGHLYVLEGSRLGSGVIMRDLASRAPALAQTAGAYLRESEKIDAWKRLSTRLQKVRDGRDMEQTIIDDALFVFGLFEEAWRATDSAEAKVIQTID